MLAARAGLLAIVLLLSVACGGDGPPPSTPRPTELSQIPAGPREDSPSALDGMSQAGLPSPLIGPNDLRYGGPPPDGIPAIDAPRFERARDVQWMARTEPLLSVTIGEETRGYPLQVMTWHEIVNDTIGGEPVAVTYCPLCNSGVAFDRRLGDRVLSFGTSGRLYQDNLVMYDRQTHSLWPQATGRAVAGTLTGTKLTAHPIGTVAWHDFAAAHLDAWVLSRDTGHERNYGTNPYVGYDRPDSHPMFGIPREDGRLPVKERVVGIGEGPQAVAVRRSTVAAAGVTTVQLDGRELVVWHRGGQASALDTAAIPEGRDIGTVGVFVPIVDGRSLHFTPDAGDPTSFTDRETGSRWSVLGHATAGPLAGRRLTPYEHLDTFWFVWVAFQPETKLIS